LIAPAQANDRFDPLVTVGVTASSVARGKRSQSPSKRARAPNSAPRDTVLGGCIRGLFCLFFGFGNRFFVLLLVLLNLSPGLIGRDILRLRQSISRLSGQTPLNSRFTDKAADALAKAQNVPPDQARAQVEQYQQQYKGNGCQSQRTSKTSRGYNRQDCVAGGAVRSPGSFTGGSGCVFPRATLAQ